MSTDPTSIPVEALEAAAKVALRRYESEFSVAPNVTWRDFVPEVRELVEAVAPILLAAGRTAAAAPLAEIVKFADKQSTLIDAFSLRAALRDVARMADRAAARVAENGADHA